MFFQQVLPKLGGAFVRSALPLTLIAGLPTKALSASLSAQTFDNIYVFGDSLSDDGNAFKATGRPYSPPYYKGRFSNGPVWVEDLAHDLGLKPNPKTDFAFGGANTGSQNTLIPGVQGFPGLEQQIKGFTATNPSVDPKALYIVMAGGNDYLGSHVTDPTVPVNNVLKAVDSLIGVGAKNIMVGNILDLGKLPGTSGNTQISNQLSALSSAHNSNLATALGDLSQKLNPDTKIIPLDVYSLFNKVTANPSKFGFTNVTGSCLNNSTTCAANPNKFLYWDDLHPSAAAHKLVADLAFSELKSEPVSEPTDKLGILALSALGAVAVYKRKQKKTSSVKSKVVTIAVSGVGSR